MFKFRLLSAFILSLNLVLFSANPIYADDDFDIDLDLDFEEESIAEPQSEKTVEPSAQTEEVMVEAPNIPQAEDKKSPQPTKKSLPQKPMRTAQPSTRSDNLDLLTKVRSNMNFTTEDVEAWIAQTADINMCLDNGKTMLLYMVASSTNLDALCLLLEFGADVQTHCTPRYEALFIAAINNPSGPIIEFLINNGANIVETDHEQNTALILASTFNKSPEVLSVLLEYGLKIQTKNKFGFDALTLAAYENTNIKVLETLIDNGADVNATDSEGHTPLMAAAIKGKNKFMQYLIKRGADYKAIDKNGLTIYDYYNKRKYLKTLDFASNKFATPSEKLSDEFTFVAKNHHRFNKALKESIFAANADEAVADAIHNLADIDILDNNGCTTFVNAAIHNNSQSVLEKLLNGKAKINATCMNGKNALMFLSAQADENHVPSLQIEKAKLLLNKGIEINHRDDVGNTALMYALANRADINYLMTLLTNNADINAENNLKETPLWTAIRQNLPSNIIKVLIEYGADVNHKDRKGETPLWYLLRTNGDEVTIRTLLRGGSDTEITNAAGDIPLWYALNKHLSPKIIENIIRAQKNLDIKNEHGDTPLLYAIKNSFPSSMIKLLLSRGANPKITDNEGNNAFDILKQNRYFDDAVQKRRRSKVLNDWN